MRLACLSIVFAFTSCGGQPEPTRPEPPATEAPPPTSTAEGDHVAPPPTGEGAMRPSKT